MIEKKKIKKQKLNLIPIESFLGEEIGVLSDCDTSCLALWVFRGVSI